MRIAIATALAGLALAAAAPAFAGDDDWRRDGSSACRSGQDAWLSLGAVEEKLVAQGYSVREIEVDDGCYEVKVRSAEGARQELYLDPVSGEIVGRDRDDDWDDRDDRYDD